MERISEKTMKLRVFQELERMSFLAMSCSGEWQLPSKVQVCECTAWASLIINQVCGSKSLNSLFISEER